MVPMLSEISCRGKTMSDCKKEKCPECGNIMTVLIQSSFCPVCENKKTVQRVARMTATQVPRQPTTHYFASGPSYGGPGGWTRDDALQACELIEPKLTLMGWHIGLTGGTLYKKGLRKDIDFIIYPHVISKGNVYSDYTIIHGPVLTIATIAGYTVNDIRKTSHYQDGKLLFKIGDSIDVFVFGTE
jgi:hypothetical protein